MVGWAPEWCPLATLCDSMDQFMNYTALAGSLAKGAVRMYYYKKGNQYFAQKSKTDMQNRVEITREVYCICMRPIWREKKCKQRERKCRDKGTSHLINRTISLDRLEEESGNLPKSATYISPEEHAVREEFHQEIGRASGRERVLPPV